MKSSGGGDEALGLVEVEDPSQISLEEPWMDDVSEAASWLSELVSADAMALDECAWECAEHLAQATALHGEWGDRSDGWAQEYQRAYDEVTRRFASTIRKQISSAHLGASAKRCGIWPL